MTRNAKVSVIIPFYNCSYVAQAVHSVLQQTYKNIEVIVVDDGSTTNIDLIEPYRSQIRYVRKENGGTATALNTGIRNMTGDYFCWLSSDDLFGTTKVDVQLKFMQARKAAASHTLFNLINEKGEFVSYNVGHVLPDRASLLRALSQGCIINGCTIMIHRNLLQRVGFFDETLRYAHDYDMWMRMAKQTHIHSCNITLVNYRIHQSMGSIQHRDEQNKEADFVRQKHHHDIQDILSYITKS